MSMQYAVFDFHCRFTSNALVSSFKGSCLRGLFGHSLKKISCTLRRDTCDHCLLRPTCVYFLMFESIKPDSGKSKKKTRVSALPHPFVLEPPPETNQSYKSGDLFDIRLTLFGDFVRYLPYLVYCIEQMGQNGFGARLKDGLGKFELLSVHRNVRKIYDRTNGILDQSHEPEYLAGDWPEDLPVSKVKIRLETPLRLKFNNRLANQMDFHVLIRACLRRISLLEETFGSGEPDLDYRGLVVQAKNVEIEKTDLKWQEITRYSNRQKTKMNMGGVTGNVIFKGAITPFMWLLKYCEKTHIGKQTAFGLGKIAVSVESVP